MGPTKTQRGGTIFALLILIGAVAAVSFASAATTASDRAGTSTARAGKPFFNKRAVRLTGVGVYAARGRKASISVTVCLQKRSGGSFINIRCRSRQSTANVVKTRVSVPGCVRGAWRTSAVGVARTRSGQTKLPAGAVSGVYRC